MTGPEKPKGPPNPDQVETYNKTRFDILREETVKRIFHPVENIGPVPAEGDEAHPHETTPQDQDRNAQETAEMGPQFPLTHYRPQPPQPRKEEGSVIVAKALAEQLGTSPDIKAQMRIDERKLAVLDEMTLAPLAHFSYRFVYDKVRYWGHVCEWWLTGSQGIGGIGRRHILQGLANTSGVQVMDKAEKPNVVERNLWNRGWKEKAEREGKVVDQ